MQNILGRATCPLSQARPPLGPTFEKKSGEIRSLPKPSQHPGNVKQHGPSRQMWELTKDTCENPKRDTSIRISLNTTTDNEANQDYQPETGIMTLSMLFAACRSIGCVLRSARNTAAKTTSNCDIVIKKRIVIKAQVAATPSPCTADKGCRTEIKGSSKKAGCRTEIKDSSKKQAAGPRLRVPPKKQAAGPRLKGSSKKAGCRTEIKGSSKKQVAGPRLRVPPTKQAAGPRLRVPPKKQAAGPRLRVPPKKQAAGPRLRVPPKKQAARPRLRVPPKSRLQDRD
ncbi:uncharacterized protein [Macrobrachium rosenbergii]|uniref:uncharacterized protein n=1 Tax=Macrobrachium rosenbergii TaxID=79674 RepID=UPI0034D68097